jgi:hypothetical protein
VIVDRAGRAYAGNFGFDQVEVARRLALSARRRVS